MRLQLAIGILTLLSLPIYSQNQDRVAGEWIVRVRPEFQMARKSTAWKGVNVVRFFGPESRFALIRGAEKDLEKISSDLLYSQPNFIYRTSESTPDPDLGNCWGLDNTGQTTPDGIQGIAGVDINATPAWELQDGSPNVVVAVIDSGIMTTHEDLKTNIWVNLHEIPNNNIDDDANGYIDDVQGWNFVAGSNNVEDDFDHGTMCAGIIGAQSNNGLGSRGVTGNVKLMAVKSLDQNGEGSTANAVSAIQYAVDNGASVINASWGGTVYDPALYEAVQWAGTKNVLFIAAAGNDGRDNDTDPEKTYPAAFELPNEIAVAAYDNQDVLASFSNYGMNTVDLGAPGVQIFSTSTTGYRYGDGTSFSAPYVTGTVALLSAYAPSLSMADLKDRILMTSTVIDYYQKEKTKTAGFLNLYQALMNIRPPRPVTPTDWTQVASPVSTPHPYLNNTNQSYPFTSPNATHIRVHFTNFDTEANYDLVTLKDGQGNIVDVYSGNLGEFTSADALGDTIVLEFTSDATMTYYGFDVDYYEFSQAQDQWRMARRTLRDPETALFWNLLPALLLPERVLAMRSGM